MPHRWKAKPVQRAHPVALLMPMPRAAHVAGHCSAAPDGFGGQNGQFDVK